MGGGGVFPCLKRINASFREILGNKVVWGIPDLEDEEKAATPQAIEISSPSLHGARHTS